MNSPVLEPTLDECGTRKSKRQRFDRFTKQAIFEWTTIQGVDNKPVYVRNIVGLVKKRDLFRDFLVEQELKKISIDKEKQKKRSKPSQKKANVKKSSDNVEKPMPQLEDEESLIPERDIDEVAGGDDVQLPELRHNTASTNDTLEIEDEDEDDANISCESVLIETSVMETKLKKHLYCFIKKNKMRNYEFCTPGVSIDVRSTKEGVLRVDPRRSTKTQKHPKKAIYTVQEGEFLFSIDGLVSKHQKAEIISIPKSKLD